MRNAGSAPGPDPALFKTVDAGGDYAVWPVAAGPSSLAA